MNKNFNSMHHGSAPPGLSSLVSRKSTFVKYYTCISVVSGVSGSEKLNVPTLMFLKIVLVGTSHECSHFSAHLLRIRVNCLASFN